MKYLATFIATYMLIGSWLFIGSANIEFIIYILVIGIIFAGTYWFHRLVHFPLWMLWLLSIWGLMHVAGGAVHIGDHVLFAQRLIPIIDQGGDFYILKYDQLVHGYLYGVVAVMVFHVLNVYLNLKRNTKIVATIAVLSSVGVSALNEIMEFLISLNMENGVGGYDNTMLDICFNLGGSIVAVSLYLYYKSRSL